MSEFQALPRQAFYVESVNTVLSTFCVTIPLYTLIFWVVLPILLKQEEHSWLTALIGGGLLSAASVAYGVYVGLLRHRRTKWRLDKHSFCFHIGLWYRHEYYIARERVQYVDVRQGPLERRFGTSQLVIYTAGTMNVVILKGLLYEDAQAVRRELINDDQTVNTP